MVAELSALQQIINALTGLDGLPAVIVECAVTTIYTCKPGYACAMISSISSYHHLMLPFLSKFKQQAPPRCIISSSLVLIMATVIFIDIVISQILLELGI